jgi:hypothetical protein
MSERETLGFLLRELETPERVGALLAAAFGIPAADVAALDYERQQPERVLFQLVPRERGFRTDVTVFADGRLAAGIDSLALAARVAPRLGADVLVSPPAAWPEAADAYAWVLLTPDGARYLVRESDPDSGSVVVDERPEARRRL